MLSRVRMWRFVIVVVGVLIMPSLQATTAYVGGGVGGGQVEDFCGSLNSQLCENNGTLIRGLAGLRFNKYIAMEVNLDDLFGLKSPYARVLDRNGNTDVITLSLSTLGFIPVGKRVSLYGGISGGLSVVNTDISQGTYTSLSSINKNTSTFKAEKTTSSQEQNTQSFDWFHDSDHYDDDDDNNDGGSNDYWDDEEGARYESDTSLTSGWLLGVEVEISENIRGRAQWQRWYSIDGDKAFAGTRDVDLFSVNFVWMF